MKDTKLNEMTKQTYNISQESNLSRILFIEYQIGATYITLCCIITFFLLWSILK